MKKFHASSSVMREEISVCYFLQSFKDLAEDTLLIGQSSSYLRQLSVGNYQHIIQSHFRAVMGTTNASFQKSLRFSFEASLIQNNSHRYNECIMGNNNSHRCNGKR